MRGKKAKAIRRAVYGDFSPRARKYGVKVQEREVNAEGFATTKKYKVTPKDPNVKKVRISGGIVADERRRKYKKAKELYGQGIIKVDGHCKGARK